MPVKEFIVESRGVGRKDYSQIVEHTVEPVIRSYQSLYNDWDEITVPAGADFTHDFTIDSEYVAMVFDFFASAPVSSLLRMLIQSVDIETLIVGITVDECGYGRVEKHISKGSPFQDIIRFVIHNFGDSDVDVTIGAIGILTEAKQYQLTLTPQRAL